MVKHSWTLPVWASMYLACYPEEYGDPPLASDAWEDHLVWEQEARVRVLAARQERGEFLWHPADIIHHPELLRRVAHHGYMTANGRRRARRAHAEVS